MKKKFIRCSHKWCGSSLRVYLGQKEMDKDGLKKGSVAGMAPTILNKIVKYLKFGSKTYTLKKKKC